jgi:transposase
MIQGGKRGAFAMGQAIAVRTDYTAAEVRRLAKQANDAAQARRLLAIGAVLDGSSRTEAATNAGMDRQTLRDWVIRFNGRGRMVWSTFLRPVLPPS